MPSARLSAAVMNAAAIAPFIIASFTRRTAIACITDSNGDQINLTGHNDGMRRAASFMLGGCYGSGVMPAFGLAGYQTGMLDCIIAGVNGLAGAPAEFTDLAFPTGHGAPEESDWMATGWPGNSASGAIRIKSNHPMDVNRGLELHSRIYRPAVGGATTLNPTVIPYESGVGTILYPSSSTPIALETRPADGITNFKWTIPAGALVNYADPQTPLGTGGGWGFREQRWTGADITGALGITYRQLVDPTKLNGVQWSKMITFGGAPTKTPASSLCQSFKDSQIAEWFRAHAVTQVDAAGNALPPMMLVQIVEGGNDAGDVTSSITYRRGAGQGGAVVTGNPVGNTKVGIKNNHQAIINRMRDVWVNTCGYAEKNLFFLLGCYHPQPPTGTQYTFVRTLAVDGWRELTQENENVCAVDGYQLATHEDFSFAHAIKSTVSPWTADSTVTFHRAVGVDNAHLNQPGYQHWGLLVWSTLLESVMGGLVDGSSLRGTLSDNRGNTLVMRN